MASLEEIRAARLVKLQKLRDAGMDPYPAKTPRSFDIVELKNHFEKYEEDGKAVSVSGRVMAVRGQGAILFAVLYDGTGSIQAIIKKDRMRPENFVLFVDAVDIGDFISVTGPAILSKTGEQSVAADSWVMAAKSLRPLPEKWHGLQYMEERYRRRYLYLLMNP